MGQALRIMRHSIEVGGKFMGIKQVSGGSIQVCQGSMGFNGVQWGSMLGMPTLSENQRNPWIRVSPPSTLRKLHVTNCSSKPKCMF